MVFIYLSFFFAATSFADVATDLSKAYELFKKRDLGIANIEDSKKIYLSVLKDQKNTMAVKREALDKFGRLSMFEGEVAQSLYRLSQSEAVFIFEQCMDASEELAPRITGAVFPEYLYWRSWCMIMWAKNAPKMKLMMKGAGMVSEFNDLIELGQQKFPEFDGYGFNRILAGVYSYSLVLKMFGLYQPEQSLKLINQLLSRSTNYYSDYIIKAKALILLNRTEEAKKALREGIDELEIKFAFEKIPELVIPDNIMFLRAMRELLAAL